MAREQSVNQVYFEESTNIASNTFTASSKDMSKKTNKVGIFIYGVADGAIVTLQAKQIETEQETSPAFININNSLGVSIVFSLNSITNIELIEGLEYKLIISSAGASTLISAQIIYDKA